VGAQDKVAARTVEGRRLRRNVLKGAVIAFVTAGYSGKRFIFEKAKELGVRAIVLDGPER
jgi:carnosine synthase